MNSTITVIHDNHEYIGHKAVIDYTDLGGLYSYGPFFLTVGFTDDNANYSLSNERNMVEKISDQGETKLQGTAYGMQLIMNILETAGVPSWEELPGTPVITLFEKISSDEYRSVVGFANADTSKVLLFKQHAESSI